MKTWQFYAIWWLFFTNITCGIALLSVASPMAQDVVGMSPMAAASMVGFIGLMNGAGRIAWATISDYIGRSATYVLFFIIEILAFWQLAGVTGAFSFQVLVLLIISCYGGGFSCMPAYLSDLFGTKYLSAITAASSRPGALPASPVPWSCRSSKKIPIVTPSPCTSSSAPSPLPWPDALPQIPHPPRHRPRRRSTGMIVHRRP